MTVWVPYDELMQPFAGGRLRLAQPVKAPYEEPLLVVSTREAAGWAAMDVAAIAACNNHAPLLLDAAAFRPGVGGEADSPLVRAWRGSAKVKTYPAGLRAWLAALWLSLGPAGDIAGWVSPARYVRPFALGYPASSRVRSSTSGETREVAVSDAKPSDPITRRNLERNHHEVLAFLEQQRVLQRRLPAFGPAPRGALRPMFAANTPAVAMDVERYRCDPRTGEPFRRLASDGTWVGTPGAEESPSYLIGQDIEDFIVRDLEEDRPEEEWFIDPIGDRGLDSPQRSWMPSRVVVVPSTWLVHGAFNTVGAGAIFAVLVAAAAGLLLAAPAALPSFVQLGGDLGLSARQIRDCFSDAKKAQLLQLRRSRKGASTGHVVELGPRLRSSNERAGQ